MKTKETHLHIRISGKQMALIKLRAKKYKVSTSEFVRAIIAQYLIDLDKRV